MTRKFLLISISFMVALAAMPADARKRKAKRKVPAADPAVTLFKEASRAFKRKKYPAAAAGYERYLELVKGKRKGEGFAAWKRRTTARKRLDALRRGLATLEVVCRVKGADVHIDDKPRGKTPLPRRIYLSKGRHRLEIRKEGYNTYRRRLKALRGKHHKVVVPPAFAAKLVPKPAPVAAASSSTEPKKSVSAAPAKQKARPGPADSYRARAKPFYKRWWFWTAVGVGAAVVVGGVTGGVLANKGASEPEMGVITFK